MMPILASGLETLIGLAIFAAFSILSALWKKRQEGGNNEWDGFDEKTDSEVQRPATARRAEPKAMDWEEEMRRLLRKAKPEESTVTRPEPPPISTRPATARRHAPPVIPNLPPAMAAAVQEHQEAALHSEVAGRVLLYEKAKRLREKLSSSLPPVHLQTRSVLAGRRHRPEVAQALESFRNPMSARKAVVASLILGPPRGLENATDPVTRLSRF